MAPVTAVEETRNTKTGPCSVTHASQATCPRSCPLFGAGCYAETGPQGTTTVRLNRSTETDPAIIAKLHADAIAGLSGTRALRLNIVGDSRTNRATKILSAAARKYRAIAGQAVWAYSHAWRVVGRKSWNGVAILASCETVADVRQATAAGYATALVVARFQSVKAYMLDGIKIVPCPQQTGKSANCMSCRLCWDDARLRATGVTIGFEAHGAVAKHVRQQLIQLGAV